MVLVSNLLFQISSLLGWFFSFLIVLFLLSPVTSFQLHSLCLFSHSFLSPQSQFRCLPQFFFCLFIYLRFCITNLPIFTLLFLLPLIIKMELMWCLQAVTLLKCHASSPILFAPFVQVTSSSIQGPFLLHVYTAEDKGALFSNASQC